MRCKSVGLLFTLALTSVTSQAQNLTPGASSYLAGTADAFLASCRSDLEDAKKRIAAIKASPSPRDAMATLQAFDTACWSSSDAENRAGLAEQVHPCEAFSRCRPGLRTGRSAACSPTSRSIKRCTTCWRRSTAPGSMPPAPITSKPHCVTTTAPASTAMMRPGRKYGQLQDELVKIGQQFDQNIAADVRKLQVNASDLDGLPEDFKRSHPPDASGKVTLATDNTDYFPFMDYAKSEPARKAFYVLYRQRAYPKNIDVMAQLLQKRHELANVLGYPDWAAYITADKMVATEQNAADFIEKITAAAQAGSKRDYEELLAYKKTGGSRRRRASTHGTSLISSAERRSRNLDTTPRSCVPISNIHASCRGFSISRSQMYGITYKPVTDAQVWHPEVTVYDVFDKDNRIGRIYFDMFPRENKYKHYATFTLATGKDGFRLPEYVLVCNFPTGHGRARADGAGRCHHFLPRVSDI